MNDLLQAVQNLTRPVMEHFPQVDDDGHLIKLHSTQSVPLLEQFHEAISGQPQAGAGGSSLPSTRNLVDGDALFEYAKMASATRGWCRMVGASYAHDPAANLDAWYPVFTAQNHDDARADWYRRELRRWASVIRAILEPPRKFEVTVPCPVCKNTHWVNPDGDLMPWPILVEYRLERDGSMSSPKAFCRVEACDAVWSSLEAIEELGQELEEVGAFTDGRNKA